MYKIVKRSSDIILSLFALIFFSPILLIIVILIKLDSKGPIIFQQKRPGLNKQLFTIYKFRTMRTDTPNVSTELLGDASLYITKLGRFLRKSSLDELPQLFNILFGHMSIVGPRPALFNQEDLIELREQASINSIKPGLTGYAQIKGRDMISDSQKVEYDEYYLKNMNVMLDVKIILWTVKSVIKSDGVRVN